MFPKQRPAALGRREKAAAKAREWDRVKAAVWLRDHRLCRVCGKKGHEAHHVVFRSLGGDDLESNAVTVCNKCHSDIHGHIAKLQGTATELLVGEWLDELNDWKWRRA